MAEARHIQVIREDGRFRLRRVDATGQASEMCLLEDDLLDLARSLPQFVSQTLSAVPGDKAPGLRPLAAIRLVHAAACPDSLQEVILLTLRDEVGLEPTYVVDPDFCLQLGTSLADLANKLIAASGKPERAS